MNNVTLGLSLGGSEIILILVLVVFWLSVIGAIAAGIIWVTRLGKTAGRYATDKMREGKIPVPPRFRNCPQCGAPLKPDAPEGLCPTCLLKHGIATEGGAPAGQSPFVPPTLSELTALFPQLEILELIGKGGMGAVYKARQPALDRFVALKILAPPHAGIDLDFASRFSREARALARLSHPNIVAVYDFGQVQRAVTASAAAPPAVETPPRPMNFFIMEYVDGPNLRQIEQAGKLSPREALQIIPQICVALQFAHDEGIVHRDIKPENVLLDKKGRVKIADFGLAKIMGPEPQDLRLTGAKDVMGTLHYMAPEQVEKPQEVDHRADIYSLGVVFYEMLTGELPLGKFQPPSQKVHVDVRLDEVVLRALAKEPERRYQQASEVKTDVETITATPGGAAATPRGTVVDQKAEPSMSPHFSRLAIVGACWAALFFMVGLWWLIPGQISPGGSVPAAKWLGVVFAFPFMAVGFSAPVGTTLLGWIAVSQIRHSPGKFYGLGLAVFDGLLFPLLALDGVFALVLLNLTGAISLLLATTLFLLIDFLIVRRVWLAVRKSVYGTTSTIPSAEARGASGSGWKFAAAIAGVLLLMIGLLIVPNLLRRARHIQDDQTSLANDLAGRVGSYLNLQQIHYDSFSVNWVPNSRQASITFAGLRERNPTNGESRELSGSILLVWDTPGQCAVAGTGDLERIHYVFDYSTPRGRRWPSAASTVAQGFPRQLIFGPVRQLIFGPVIERTVQARQTGANSFLDLDTGRVFAPPPEVVAALSGAGSDAERSWKALDITEDSRPFRYIQWLRDSGADLMFAGNGEVIGFDGVFPFAHGESSTNWESWDDLTPAELQNAVAVVEWGRKVRGLPHESWPPAPKSGGIIHSAAQMDSRESGGPIVNLLTLQQSGMWFFKTRDGGMGIFQIAGFSNNPGAVKIRYRLVQTAGAEANSNDRQRAAEELERSTESGLAASWGPGDLAFRWVALDGDTNSLADELPDPGDSTGERRLRVLKAIVLDGGAVDSAAVSVRHPLSTSTPWQLEEPDRREIQLTLTQDAKGRFAALTTTNVGRRLAIVWHEQLLAAPLIRDPITDGKVAINGRFSDAECQQLLRAFYHPPISSRTPRFFSFGPVVECLLNDPDDDVHNSFLDLDSGKVSDCPIDWPMNGATNASSFEMGIRVGLAMGTADTLLRLVREKGVDLQGDASGGSITALDMVAEPVANEEFDVTSAIDIMQRRSHEPPEDRVALHATNTPATWLFRTREGGVGVLQITGFTTNAPRAAKIRYKLVRSSAPASAPQPDAAHRSAGRRPAVSPTASRHYSTLAIRSATGRHRA